MCEQCRGNWGDEIYDTVEAFLDKWPDAEWGPAHIILSDFNCDEGFISSCLREIPLWKSRDTAGLVAAGLIHPGYEPPYDEHTHDELDATAAFLSDTLLPLVKARESAA